MYPRENRDLFARVREVGALVSEYALGEAPLTWRFPARKSIIAGLSDAVVVVEAPENNANRTTALLLLAGCGSVAQGTKALIV